jgi:hypothetical protein
LAQWLKRIAWLLSVLRVLLAIWLTPSAKYHGEQVLLLSCCWVAASFAALILEKFTKQPDVGRQIQQP